jgi:hypothetical protein
MRFAYTPRCGVPKLAGLVFSVHQKTAEGNPVIGAPSNRYGKNVNPGLPGLSCEQKNLKQVNPE